MELISNKYRKDNEQFHHDCFDYGGGGSRRLVQVCAVIDEYSSLHILDYGSGKGDLTKTLRGVYPHKLIYEYDPCMEGKTSILRIPYDFVICNDVMEHVEIEFLDNVLAHIESLTGGVCFFCIGLRPANKILPDGRNTHITLLSKEIWVSKIKEHFNVEDIYMIGSGKLCVICKTKMEH